MRGNKSFKKFFLIVAMLTLSIATCFAFNGGDKKVFAEDNSIYNRSYASQEYDDGVIFSAEQVYFAEGRTTPLYYDSDAEKPVTNILGYDDKANYFANYKGGSSTGVGSQNDTRSKKIIYPGDFVLIDDLVPMTAYKADTTAVSLKQGIMMTLGGYIAEKDSQGNVTMYTNAPTDTTDTTDTEKKFVKMSKLTAVSITITRDGQGITNTGSDFSLRTYNSGMYFDFVCFFDCDKSNEGYYQIYITYTLEGQSSVSHYFDFYMLLNSSYVDRVEVNGQSYASFPEIVNVKGTSNKYYQLIDNDQMPVLTYDYKHFDLTYNYQVNDLVSKVVVDYEEKENRLRFTTTTNNVSSTRYYKTENGNNIVSLLFANIGTYQFNFEYVYYYNNERLAVDNLSIDSIELKIYGYETKYARYGFDSAVFKKLTISKNGTMIVPVDAYTASEAEMLKDIDLGYIYETENDTTQKTGVITKIESPKLTAKVEGEGESQKTTLTTTDNISIDKPTVDGQKLAFASVLTSAQYINTDQGGVWFNLNDEYVLTDSYYVYSNIAFKTGTTGTTYDIINFQKDTTFTKLGYYFVCVNYKCDADTKARTQYFAFRISSSTPNVQIMTTTESEIKKDADDKRIYSNQYTNKNVYTLWDEPGTFESKLTAYLYSSADKSKPWATKDSLMNYAKGVANSSLTKQVWQQTNLLTANGSYLLEMNVVGSQSKVYYYFVIDKEDISGIETLGVSSATIGSNMVYNVASDSKGNPVTYTDSLAISQSFAMWWSDKASGAQITAKYKFAPIVYSKQSDEKTTITNNGTTYTYFVADYKLSNFSSFMSIEKPVTQYSVVDTDNVLTKQGVYWFYLQDEAGNTMNYMVVLDNTEAKFEAKSGTNNLASGETSSVDVTIDWGDYKVLNLGLKGLDGFVGEDGKNYFKGDKSNYTQMSMWTKNGDGYDLQIANEKMILNCLGKRLTLNIDGTTSGASFSSEQLTINNGHSIILKPIMQEMTYTLKVFGQNQKYSSDSNSYFTVTLNKDRSEGKIKSTSEDGGEYTNTIRTYNDEFDANKLKANYLTGQATDDGIVVFEWLSGEGSSYEVGDVYYEYYPLMTQEELDRYTNNADYEFYPYSKTSTKHYIFGGNNNAQNYTITTVGDKTFYRSFQINVGRVSYYENNVLTSKYATMPGMYVITRIYKNEVEDDATTRNYVFFVDRNQIIDYSTTSTSSKTVGTYIDLFMQDKLSFDKFSQYSSTVTIGENNYNIYLESNKLPLEIRIPTGKYASYNGGIKKTSNSISGGLKFNLYYVDEYGYLGLGKNASFKLFAMEDMQMLNDSYVDNGYITYLLNTSSLYMDNSNGGNVNKYLSACSKVGADYLSLPGSYIIEILDNVGIVAKADKTYEMEDCNVLYLGVKITQNNPSVNAYAGKLLDGIVEETDRIETVLADQNVRFDTNKTYVMYELPTPDESSTNAQIDDEYIYITRIDETGKEEVYYDAATDSGIIKSTSAFGDNIKYIDKRFVGKTIIWLDTGVVLDNDNQIIDYKEYQYKIVVKYKLYNNDTGYYTYNQIVDGKVSSTLSFYQSNFTINIDRTPILDNLNSFVHKNDQYPSQKEFLNEYIENVSDYSIDAVSGKLDETIFNTIAYRRNDGEINYAVVNKLYYYLLDGENANLANLANYAIRVSENQKVDLSLGKMYYRKISNGANLMSLLPITSKYNEIGFAKFNENDLLSSGFGIVDDKNTELVWGNYFNANGYYEIIEMDGCGNYTQYVILYNGDEGASTYNSTIYFNKTSDIALYTAYLNFVKVDGAIKFETSLVVEKNESGQIEKTDTISLDNLSQIEDMFGNEKTLTTQNAQSFDGTTDYFYKLVLKYKAEENEQAVDKVDSIWTNTATFNVAEWLYARMGGGNEGNFTLSVTNRFNQTITLEVNISKEAKNMSLNYDDFKTPIKETIGETDKYYLDPSILIATNASETFKLYATNIVVYDTTSSLSYTYYLNNNGEITSFIDSDKEKYEYKDNKFVSVGNAEKTIEMDIGKIYLTNGNYYNITIYDSYGRVKTLQNIYAGEGSNDYQIDCKIATVNNNIYYTTNQVTVSYPVNKYNGIKVSIWRDDALIVGDTISNDDINEKLKNNITTLVVYDKKTYINSTTNDNSTISFVLCPEEATQQVSQTGAKLKYQIQYLQNGASVGASTIVIDNRVGGISLANEDSISKTNIVRVDYNNTIPAQIDAETLFNNSPSLSLSETVQLGWEALQKMEYTDSIENSSEKYEYFNRKVFLYSYSSSDHWEISELTSASEPYKWISPKEDSIGRYVLVYALYNKGANGGGQCMMYKAFAFNITSTANAMYEIQDKDGNVQEYDAYLKGSEFETILKDYKNLSGTSYWDSVKAQFGFVTENELNDVGKRFETLNIPVYVTNDNLILVPNGDNNVQSKVYTCKIKDSTYTLDLHQVYNDVHTTYVAILSVEESSNLAGAIVDLRYVATGSSSDTTNLTGLTLTTYKFGKMYFPYFYKGGLPDNSPATALVKTNKLYLEVYYRYSENEKEYVGRIDGQEIDNEKMIEFKTAGSYQIYLKDTAGNTHIWGTNTNGKDVDYLTINVVPEVLISVNGQVPVDYAYYNGEVKVDVCFSNLYDNNSTTIKAYKNGSSTEYITSEGGRKTNYLSSYTFTDYGTYRVVVSAKRDKDNEISKTIIFSIINPYEARLALDFTSISKYEIKSVTNSTTDMDVSDVFSFLLNEGFIYSKLITFERLSKENAFGSTVGKQTFEVEYLVNSDPLVPARTQKFEFTINNQTPSMQCSISPGKSTTKDITIKLNPQTIYRQVGDCYVVVNGNRMLTIDADNSQDRILTLTLSEVGVYYVQIVSDSGRVISSFQVEIKEPLNTWSIILIVAIVLLVVGTITIFIVLRTKMRVR